VGLHHVWDRRQKPTGCYCYCYYNSEESSHDDRTIDAADGYKANNRKCRVVE